MTENSQRPLRPVDAVRSIVPFRRETFVSHRSPNQQTSTTFDNTRKSGWHSNSTEEPLSVVQPDHDLLLWENVGDFDSATEQHHAFEGMVGSSASLHQTQEQVITVAPTGSTVLIEGETGTGKELVARAIHNLSPRRERHFVRFNCAAIPLGLLESELFGHEKGAFTGAITRKIGRFELAHRGTLFLDEIGDIPLELQAKLLRVLQEGEFERLGSTQTQEVDVRIVAATHRDLKQMVSEKLFRGDLYFRLNIFPISVPPLRQRREDIPLLVRAFIEDCSRRMNRAVTAVPAETMRVLAEYDWPGNIRELQNFIERSVIMSPANVLRAPLESLSWSQQLPPTETKTLAEMEALHIVKALKETGWVIGGPRGAARKLGLKRTTLIGRIRKLGLSRSCEAKMPFSESGLRIQSLQRG